MNATSNHSEADISENHYEFDRRRAMSGRDYVQNDMIQADIESINRSQDIINGGANPAQYVSIAANNQN